MSKSKYYVFSYLLKKGIIMSFLFTVLLSFLGCSQESNKYKQAEIFNKLREKAFSILPSELGVEKKDNAIVYGVIMETGYPEAVVSLIALGDGSVSLYFSNGGGIIGIGEHDKPKQICLEYISKANEYIKFCRKVKEHKLPKEGETLFYFITFDGLYSYKETEEALGNNKTPLTELFYKAQELITEARMIEEKRKSEPTKK